MKKGIMQEQEMRAPSISYNHLLQIEATSRVKTDPYQNLANAILCVAADDYRMALSNDRLQLQEDLESFFRSDWSRILNYGISAVSIMQSIKME